MSSPASEAQNPNVSFERERGVYAVEVTHDVAHAVISIGDDTGRIGRVLHVLRALADAHIPVFLVKTHRTVLTLAFATPDFDRVVETVAASGMTARTRRDLALVVVRATQMRDLTGIMTAIADAFVEGGAQIFECGDSHNSVQCLIEAANAPASVAELCRTFHLDVGAVTERSITEEDFA